VGPLRPRAPPQRPPAWPRRGQRQQRASLRFSPRRRVRWRRHLVRLPQQQGSLSTDGI